jgi:hypothetical protein
MTYSSDENHSTEVLAGNIFIILWMTGLLLFTPHVLAGECGFLDQDNYPSGWKLPATAIDTDALPGNCQQLRLIQMRFQTLLSIRRHPLKDRCRFTGLRIIPICFSVISQP